MATITRPPADDFTISLLPDEIRQKQRLRRMLMWIGVAGIGLILILVVVTVLQRQAISNAERELRTLQATEARLRSDVAALREFGELQARIDTTRATLRTALTGDIEWSRFMADLALTIPDNSWVTSLQMTASQGTSPDGLPSTGTVRYSGFVAATFPGLSHWLTVMDDLEGLRFVYLGQGSKQEQDGRTVVSFSADAHLTQTMLSGRCQTEGARCP